GAFTILPPRAFLLESPEDAVVSEVLVAEGMRVAPGAPLLRLRNLELERQSIAARRVADSLSHLVRVARAESDAGMTAELGAELRSGTALAEGLEARARSLTLRAVAGGIVVSERPAELLGRQVAAGAPLLLTGAAAGGEARVRLHGAGASLVRPGQEVRLALRDGRTALGVVESMAPVSDSAGVAEARVRVQEDSWRLGSTGRARITLRRSTIGGAALWRLRSAIRSDILF